MQDDEITITAALPQHEAAIRSLSDKTHALHRARLPHVFGPENSTQHKFLDALFQPDTIGNPAYRSQLLVACRKDDLLGYVLVMWDAPNDDKDETTAMIADIATFEHARSQGIGTLLLNHLRVRMSTEGWTTLVAEVWQDNDASHAMFTGAEFGSERTEYRYGQPAPKTDAPAKEMAPAQYRWLIPLLIILAVALVVSIL